MLEFAAQERFITPDVAWTHAIVAGLCAPCGKRFESISRVEPVMMQSPDDQNYLDDQTKHQNSCIKRCKHNVEFIPSSAI